MKRISSLIFNIGISILCILFWPNFTQAQSNSVLKKKTFFSVQSGNIGTVLIDADEYNKIGNIKNKLIKTEVRVTFHFKSTFNLGSSQSTSQYTIPLSFDMIQKDGLGNVLLTDNKTLVLSDKVPTVVFYKDISSSPAVRLDIDNAVLSPSYDPLVSATAIAQIANELELTVEIIKTFNIGIKASDYYISNPPCPCFPTLLSQTLVTSTKNVDFSWASPSLGCEFPNYEFQLLKLSNVNNTYNNSYPSNPQANIDWSNALTIETQSSKRSLTLTINEGTGFYVWRVRPIGSFGNGYADPDNLGNFSEFMGSANPPSSGIIPMAINSTYSTLFHYTDPDENINWTHSKTYAEENKSKEVITYANGLLQVRQTQTWTPTDNTLLSAQQILDFSARPSISLLPLIQPNQTFGGYQSSIVLNSNNVLYTEDDFDSDIKLNNPGEVLGRVDNYFDGTKLDNGKYPIPNAEGYPYTRTTFYGDGSDRHKESSGVGKTHMIGQQDASGRTHTTRTLYSNPADEELIRLFGDEAPRADAISKITVVDPNNTTSVTYKNREGKVIATCLSYNDEQNNNQLQALSTLPTTPLTVTQKINQNVSSAGNIVSSSRLTFTENANPVEISYKCSNTNISSCIASGQCSYRIQFVITDLDNPTDASRNFSTPIIDLNCPSAGNSLYPNYINASSSLPTSSSPPQANAILYCDNTDPLKPKCVFPAGNFLVEKKLILKNNNTLGQSAAAKADAMSKYSQVLNYAIGKVNDQTSLDDFYLNIASFNPCDTKYSEVNDKDGNGVCDFIGTDFSAISVSLVRGVDNKVTGMLVNTSGTGVSGGCCPSATVPLRFELAKTFDCTNKSNLSEYLPSGSMDLYGYLDVQIQERYKKYKALNPNTAIPAPTAATFLPGYTTMNVNGSNINEFNYMVYLMLNQKYYTGRTIYNQGTQHLCKYDATAPNHIGNPLSNSDYIEQYQCADVWKCWISAVASILDLTDKLNQDFLAGTGSQQSHQDSEQKSDRDNNFEEANTGNAFQDWLSGSLSKKMSADPGSDGNGEDVDQSVTAEILEIFLECTGYKFAGILVKDCSGDIKNQSVIDDYYTKNNSPNLVGSNPEAWHPANGSINYDDSKGPCGQVNLLNADRPVKTYNQENLYTHFTLFDRIYAFKYFEYVDKDYYCSGNSNVFNNSSLEFANCFYANPSVPSGKVLCEPMPCENGYETWSSAQRFAFFMQLKSGVKTIEKTGSSSPASQTDCDAKKGPLIDAHNNSCNSACEARKPEFRSLIRSKLLERCYVINGCNASNSVTEQQIEDMAQALYVRCTTNCDIVDPLDLLVSYSQCSYYEDNNPCIGNLNTVSYCSIQLAPCKKLALEQAQGWQPWIDFEQKCNPAPNPPLDSYLYNYTTTPFVPKASNSCANSNIKELNLDNQGGRQSVIQTFTVSSSGVSTNP